MDEFLLQIMKLFIGAIDARSFQMNKLCLGCAPAAWAVHLLFKGTSSI